MNEALLKPRTKLELLQALARRHGERPRPPAKAQAQSEPTYRNKPGPKTTLAPA